jgi:hypothetical protein
VDPEESEDVNAGVFDVLGIYSAHRLNRGLGDDQVDGQPGAELQRGGDGGEAAGGELDLYIAATAQSGDGDDEGVLPLRESDAEAHGLAGEGQPQFHAEGDVFPREHVDGHAGDR